jgi:hypothetical protein
MEGESETTNLPEGVGEIDPHILLEKLPAVIIHVRLEQRLDALRVQGRVREGAYLSRDAGDGGDAMDEMQVRAPPRDNVLKQSWEVKFRGCHGKSIAGMVQKIKAGLVKSWK